MKIFMVTDMEGVRRRRLLRGPVPFPTAATTTAGKKLVTGEVNAAVDGLLDAGVEEVLVWDGHGAGGIDFDTVASGRAAAAWPAFAAVEPVARR